MNWDFLRRSARTPTINNARGMGGVNRGFVQLQEARFLLQGPRFPLMGPSVPLAGPPFPLAGALFSCLIVCRSPRLNCTDPQGASKNTGLGRTQGIQRYSKLLWLKTTWPKIISAGNIHHVMWSFLAKICSKNPQIITWHDVLEPSKQVLSASRDVIMSGQIWGRSCRGFHIRWRMLAAHYCLPYPSPAKKWPPWTGWIRIKCLNWPGIISGSFSESGMPECLDKWFHLAWPEAPPNNYCRDQHSRGSGKCFRELISKKKYWFDCGIGLLWN